MKNSVRSILALLAFFTAPLPAQVLITNFGNTATASSEWLYNPNTSTLSGTEAFGAVLFGAPSTPNLSGNAFLSLTASATMAPAGSFSIVLEDSSNNLATANFVWNAFTGGSQTVTQPLQLGGFDPSQVVGWRLVSGGSLQNLNVTFGQMSVVAVPEPSTVGLLATFFLAAVCIQAVRLSTRGARLPNP